MADDDTQTGDRVERATVDLARGEAYAVLAAVSHSLINDVNMPSDMEKNLYVAIQKMREAFKFEPGDVS